MHTGQTPDAQENDTEVNVEPCVNNRLFCSFVQSVDELCEWPLLSRTNTSLLLPYDRRARLSHCSTLPFGYVWRGLIGMRPVH